MLSSSNPARIWPSLWANALRDRLVLFRLLCVVFALLTLAGVAGTLGFTSTSPLRVQAATAVSTLALAAIWIRGYRKAGLPIAILPFEGAFLIAIAYGIQNIFAVFGVMYIALQQRATFGSRRDATITAFAYAGIFLLAHAVVPGEAGSIRPIVVVELAAGAFNAYLMHTLAEVLGRDQDRRRALRESEQRFRAVIENLHEALVITDENDRIIIANPRVKEILGYSPDEMIGRSAVELLAPAGMRDEFSDRVRTRLAGVSELYETELVRADGTTTHVEVSASPLRDGTGAVRGTIGAVSDRSEQRRLEDRLRKGMRMEAIGQLAGGVAHDFNNLLTVIKCNAEMLISDMDPNDPQVEGVRQIQSSANRGALLTQQLLAFSRKQLLNPRRVCLSNVVAECEPLLRRLVGRNVTLTVRRDAQDIPVHSDPLQLEHALATLVQNANDAMPDGGSLTIETQMADLALEHGPIATQEIPIAQYALLSVTDTGKGMSEEVAARLFEPFFTTKAPGEGTGMGLASLYGVVRQSGGYVDVDSAPGQGTTFRIYLPLAFAAIPETELATA